MLCRDFLLMVEDRHRLLCDYLHGRWPCLHIVLVCMGLYTSVLYMRGALGILGLIHILALVL